MTRKISLITAVAVSALAVGVPTAFGEGRLAGSQEPVVVSQDVPLVSVPDSHDFGQPAVGAYLDAHERGVGANQSKPQWLNALAARSEGLNKKYGLGEFVNTSTVANYRDAHERGVVANQSEPQWLNGLAARSEGLNRKYGLGEFANTVANYRDAHERAVPPTTGSAPVSITSSGREIEWPQIGVGFGIGIVLVLGLILGLKATRNPPLAH